MKFSVSDTFHFPCPLVYQTMRDSLVELSPYLPNIKKIEVLERREIEGSKTQLVNKWVSHPTQVPKVAKPFIKEEFLTWKDYATWNNDTFQVEWHFETDHFKGLYTCQGQNIFQAMDEKNSQLTISGELQIHPDKIPGVPKFLGSKVAPVIEKFILNLVTPNLKEMSQGLKIYLEARQ